MTSASETARTTGESAGVYLYGIVPADVEVDEHARGVGPPGAVTVIRHGDIAALVSELDPGRAPGTPQDREAHERLLDATAAEVPVLPIRFGTVVSGSEAVVEELLAPYHDEFARALGEFEGRVTYVIECRYVERALTDDVVAGHPELAELSGRIGDRPTRLRIGEIVNEAVSARREADGRELVAAVGPVCVLTAPRPPAHARDGAMLAVLVDAGRTDELEKAVSGLAERWADRVEVRLRGPLAPYDFMESPSRDGPSPIGPPA
ncbi:GvpL/GvpF family gas vesicle protein [Nonomuraea sp. K274]|uniref:GvpL/GvpF family gas vesicle protein n=1 Tax=Nonomuraea cypriaca TaxID=1187855 RepID=A0A931F2Z6_9ACTN|nr:GvpL/GvpF family gas vesicle protein [Nonomuraea cypriaca]MBF8189621.1 GvpL/GvpF family gas vesicle protein [Nonomuraea cypriaca]